MAQETEKSSPVLYIDLGVKYALGEGQAGPILGISLDIPSTKFAYNLRGDLVYKIGRTQPNQNGYQVVHYTTYNYLDVDYKIAKAFRLTGGVGWIYGSLDSNAKLDSNTGYLTGTLAIKYKVLWLNLELRGDIPIMNETQKATLNQQSPLSLAFRYQFSPGKKS